jgi:hypothetical protein
MWHFSKVLLKRNFFNIRRWQYLFTRDFEIAAAAKAVAATVEEIAEAIAVGPLECYVKR